MSRLNARLNFFTTSWTTLVLISLPPRRMQQQPPQPTCDGHINNCFPLAFVLVAVTKIFQHFDSLGEAIRYVVWHPA